MIFPLEPNLIVVQRPGESLDDALGRGYDEVLERTGYRDTPQMLMCEPADVASLELMIDVLETCPVEHVDRVIEHYFEIPATLAELRQAVRDEPRMTVMDSGGIVKSVTEVLEGMVYRCLLWEKPSMTIAEAADALCAPLEWLMARLVAEGDLIEHPGDWDEDRQEFIPDAEKTYLVNPVGELKKVEQ